MALTSSVKAIVVPGAWFEAFSTVTGDTSYPAGGYALSPALFGLNAFATKLGNTIYPIVIGQQLSTGSLDADIDSSGKLHFFYPTGGGGTVPAVLAAPVVASGATAVTSSAAQAPINPGQGKEVATGTNLSTVSVLLLAFGT